MSGLNENEVFNTTQNVEPPKAEKKKGGVAGLILSIVGFLTSGCLGFGGILCLVGLILSIVGLAKKKAKKGLAIAAIIVGALGFIGGIIALAVEVIVGFTGGFATIGAFIGMDSLNNYLDNNNVAIASSVASDEALCDSIESALTIMMMDPSIVSDDDEYRIIEAIQDGKTHYLTDIPSGDYRDGVEEILGMSFEEAEDDIKSGDRIVFTCNGTSVTVQVI